MPTDAQSGQALRNPSSRRIVFITNGLFNSQLAGGDIHLLHSIQAITAAGWEAEYLTSRQMVPHLKAWNLPGQVTFTDCATKQAFNDASLKGKRALFWEFFCRCLRSLGKLRRIGPEDVCFSPTDYWFDVVPMVCSRAKLKVMVLQMKAPSLKQVIFRTRADVEATRIASLHYCLSQWLSLTLLRFCRQKRIIAVQPLLQNQLRQMGYRPEETPLIPNGFDLEMASQTGDVAKQYDVVWIGRLHRQKGIEDLLRALQVLAGAFPDFKALLIGNLAAALAEPLARLGLTAHVHFAGYVTGVEKFRCLKSARVFLMPSRHEGLPIVVGEALACDLPVVAYELEMYRPFFGGLIFYVEPFKLDDFCRAAVVAVQKARAGETLIDERQLAVFKAANSWQAVGCQVTAVVAASGLR
jgi:glycosyltransferase involved in cell wall biosynthesis